MVNLNEATSPWGSLPVRQPAVASRIRQHGWYGEDHDDFPRARRKLQNLLSDS